MSHCIGGRGRIRPAALAPLVAGIVSSGCGAREAAVPPRRIAVEIRGLAFIPAHLELRAGDTIAWINRDILPHTATATGNAWDTGTIAAGDTARTVVIAAGKTAYHCAFHPTMEAELTVR